MTRFLVPLLASVAMPAWADAPRVVADIGPVHSMVARVMDGVGEPELLIPTAVSPHGYAMRPSEANALARADLVVWVGEGLTPWLGRAVDTLVENGVSLALLDTAGTAYQAEETAEDDGHDDHPDATHEGDDHDAHGHDDHASHDDHEAHGEDHDAHGHDDHSEEEAGHHDHAHDDAGHDDHDHTSHEAEEDHADHADHADDHGGEEHADAHGHDHHGHDHGGIDPHAWLDPASGKLWLDAIAKELARLDPENAIIYAANAEAGKAEIDALTLEIRERMAPLQGKGFITFHDAYHGFEVRFGMPSLGAISVSDAVPASAGQVAALRDVVRVSGAVCVFSEPQFDPSLVETLTDGTDARSGVLDPLGATLQPGIPLYANLLRDLSLSFEACLTE